MALALDETKRLQLRIPVDDMSQTKEVDVSGTIVDAGQARAAGFSRSGFHRAAKSGEYQRIARGLYVPADAEATDWDWLEAAARRSDATVCLSSALAYWDLTDEIPNALDVAIPRGARRPATTAPIRWHLFARDTFGLGRHTLTIPGTQMVMGIYSPERSIADAFRLRGDVGYEVGRDALRRWLQRGGQPATIAQLATQLPRAKGPLLNALEALA
jgi:predicted transcriptional regulator of viral defense system